MFHCVWANSKWDFKKRKKKKHLEMSYGDFLLRTHFSFLRGVVSEEME